MSDDVIYLSARDQLARLQAGKISARSLLDAHVARDAQVHATINAVIVRDLDRARRDADAIDAARAAGRPLGPLAGLPMTVKDGFDVNGMPAVAGDKAFLGRDKTCADAIVVARVRAAGAVIWGKTNVPRLLSDYQTYNDIYGTTNNPYDVTRTTAGSSGGAAAALACGITPLEIGSDIGGSLRNPANFCGVVSVKPTHGLIPCDGHIPPPPGNDPNVDLNVCGPMARNVGDLRLLFQVLSQQTLPPSFTGPIRAAIWGKEPGFPLARDVGRSLQRAGAAVQSAGGKIQVTRLPFTGRELMHSYLRMLIGVIGVYDDEAVKQARPVRWLAQALGLFDRRIWSPWAVVKAITASPAEIEAARRARDVMKTQMAAFFENYDVLISPVTPVPPFAHDHGPILQRSLKVDGASWLYTSCLSWVGLCNALHLPAVTIQAGRTSEGLPVGVQLIGPWNSEFKLLDIAERLEPILSGFTPPKIV